MADTREIWAAKNDDELLEAADALSEFTDEAQQVIRTELRKRGLPQPSLQLVTPEPADDGREPELVSVLVTGDSGLIGFAKSLLDSEKIECLVRGEDVQDLFGIGRFGSSYNLVTGPVEFLVRAEDAERARALLDGIETLPPDPLPDAEQQE